MAPRLNPVSRALTRLGAHLGLVGTGAAAGAAADAALAGLGVGGAASTLVRLGEDVMHARKVDAFLPDEQKGAVKRAAVRLAAHANVVLGGAIAGMTVGGGSPAAVLTGVGVGGAVSTMGRLTEDFAHAGGFRELVSKTRSPDVSRRAGRLVAHTQAVTTGAAVGSTLGGGSPAATWVGMGVGGATSAAGRLVEDWVHAAKTPSKPDVK